MKNNNNEKTKKENSYIYIYICVNCLFKELFIKLPQS